MKDDFCSIMSTSFPLCSTVFCCYAIVHYGKFIATTRCIQRFLYYSSKNALEFQRGRIVSDEALSAANNGYIFARKATMLGAILTAEKQMVLWENSIKTRRKKA